MNTMYDSPSKLCKARQTRYGRRLSSRIRTHHSKRKLVSSHLAQIGLTRSLLLVDPHIKIDSSSLNYSTVGLPIPHRSGGISIGSSREHELASHKYSPGPGQYDPKDAAHSQSTVFGTERRNTLGAAEKADSPTFHVDVFVPMLDTTKLRGPSFGNCRKSLDEALPHSSTPGPGYYNKNLAEKAVRPNPTSYTISMAEILKGNTTGSEVPFIDPRSSIASSTRYQRFSQLSRFCEERPQKRHFDYRRLIFPVKSHNGTIVHRNAKEVQSETRESRVQRILSNKMKLRVRMEMVRRTEQRITDESVEKITLDHEEAERKRIRGRERANVGRLRCDWTMLGAAAAWMTCLAGKYNTRREVRKRTTKFMKLIFVTFWAIGKMIRKIRGFGMRKATRILGTVARANLRFWRTRRKLRALKSVAKFVGKYEENPTLLLFLKFVIFKIRKVQLWFRRIYARKMVMIAIMNAQWSAVEAAVIKVREGERKEGAISEAVDEAIREGRTSSVVPVPVRLFYIRRWLKAFPAGFTLP